MKIHITNTLNNITENNIKKDSIKGIKDKNTIRFIIDNEKYNLKILSNKEIVLNRNSDITENTMYFKLNKKSTSIYTVKKEGYNLEIDIKTTYLNIKENIIEIHYTIIDSNSNYEYIIEMSEVK